MSNDWAGQIYEYLLYFVAMFTTLSNRWRQWPYKGWTLLVLIILIFVFIGLILASGRAETPVKEQEKAIPEVAVQTIGEIAQKATVDTTTTFELVNAASLVSRLGGRVTAIHASLGSRVRTGQVVIAIDGGGEANPAQVQATNASISLGLFGAIENQTRASLDNAVAIAKSSFDSARTGKTLNAQIQQKNQVIAENSVDLARVNQEKTAEVGDDILTRSANISVNAAKLAQDQAQLAQRVSLNQNADAVKLSQKNLAGAQIARNQTLATLASQKAGLEAQLRSASEQVKLMQVIAPLSGQVSRLTVKVGDFVRPGDQVGEVASIGNAKGTIFVPRAVRDGLKVGQVITLKIDGQETSGFIQAIAASPSATSSLWQVDISTREAVNPNSTVTVSLPITTATASATFVPLDSLNVREGSIVIFTVDANDIVHEHAFVPIHYYNQLVEGKTDVPLDVKIVVSGNRTLRDGDHVKTATK